MSEDSRDAWYVFDDGKSVGQRGSENGVILLDEEHPVGARITLERDGDAAPSAITCGIYGWMVHTRFLGSLEEAEVGYRQMKTALAAILATIPLESDPDVDERMAEVSGAIGRFVDEFP